MNSVTLPGSSRKTSRLGFGTSGLAGELTYRESIAILEVAFEAGIRHFDTAPLYGAGAAEKLLGDFAVRKRSEITLATKFGLMPPRAKSLLLLAKGIIRPLLRRVPGLKSSLAKPVSRLSRPPSYSRAEMTKSLNASLRTLRTEYIDLLLMHEAEETDISEEVRKALDDAVRAGRIGSWGVGGSRDKIGRIVADISKAPPVAQFGWSMFSDRLSVYEDLFCITYGAISLALSRLKALLSETEKRRRWSNEIDVDLSDSNTLPRLLVGAALAANTSGIVLFSSKKKERIRDIASLLHTNTDEASAKFLRLLERERATSLA